MDKRGKCVGATLAVARPGNATLCRAGAVCPAGGTVENRFGSSGRPTPTLHSTIELRRGRCPRRPVRISYQILRRARKNPPVTASPCQPPLGKGGHGDGDADCHTSDIGHWFAMTGFFHELRCKSGQRVEGTPPYNHTLCRAGPVCPAGGRCVIGRGRTPPLRMTSELVQARCGPSWTPTPTKFYR